MRTEVYTPSFGFDAKRKVWQINGADIDANRIIQLAAMIQAERQERVVGRGFSKFTQIASAVAAATDVTIEEMISRDRRMQVAEARHITIYLCRIRTGETMTAIGKYFARDHTTVIHAIRKVEDLIEIKDKDTMVYLEDVDNILNQTQDDED